MITAWLLSASLLAQSQSLKSLTIEVRETAGVDRSEVAIADVSFAYGAAKVGDLAQMIDAHNNDVQAVAIEVVQWTKSICLKRAKLAIPCSIGAHDVKRFTLIWGTRTGWSLSIENVWEHDDLLVWGGSMMISNRYNPNAVRKNPIQIELAGVDHARSYGAASIPFAFEFDDSIPLVSRVRSSTSYASGGWPFELAAETLLFATGMRMHFHAAIIPKAAQMPAVRLWKIPVRSGINVDRVVIGGFRNESPVPIGKGIVVRRYSKTGCEVIFDGKRTTLRKPLPGWIAAYPEIKADRLNVQGAGQRQSSIPYVATIVLVRQFKENWPISIKIDRTGADVYAVDPNRLSTAERNTASMVDIDLGIAGLHESLIGRGKALLHPLIGRVIASSPVAPSAH